MRCDGMLGIQSNKMVMYSDDTETCDTALCKARMLDMAWLLFFLVVHHTLTRGMAVADLAAQHRPISRPPAPMAARVGISLFE